MSVRDLETAKKAYEIGDSDLSIQAHKTTTSSKEPHAGGVSDYIQSIVFGGLDGIITTFAVVVAAVASHLSYGSILIIGFANLLGDAIGMGVGDYISSKAEDDHEQAERDRERWELDNVPEIEKQEMVDIYKEKGLSTEDATAVVNLLFESKEAFLELMLIEELHIIPAVADYGDNDTAPWKSALITFGAFMILGGLPMLPYLFSIQYNHRADMDEVFWVAVALFAVCLYTLGALKGKFTGKRWWLTGLTMLFNGGLTTVISYLIGYLVEMAHT